VLNHEFASKGLTLRISFESSDMTTAFALVSRGFGVALVPQSTVAVQPYEVAAVPVGPNPLTRRVAIVWSRERYRPRELEPFVQHAKRRMARS
jgi:DNA-binding transcriptional LysR family regulator